MARYLGKEGFGGYTTIVAFLPLAYIGGIMGKFIAILPVVVICCLLISLTEFRFHVLSEIAPFRNCFNGIFFVALGMGKEGSLKIYI